jgi:hypothetical protein
VFALVLFLAAGLPLVDTFVTPGDQLVLAGSRTSLRALDAGSAVIGAPPDLSGREVQFVPATGWEVRDEARGRGASSSLARNGVSFDIEVVRSDRQQGSGCEAELDVVGAELGRIDRSGALRIPQSFTTDAGSVGLRAAFAGARVEGLGFVLCAGELVMRARAAGPTGSLQGEAAEPVIGMVESATFT